MDNAARTLVLREWAVIYDSVLRGQQIVDLRKGGIHETGKHFTVRARRFWLYPSYAHQSADLLKRQHLPALERVLQDAPPAGVIRIRGWADLVATAELSRADELAALDDEFIWTRSYAETRLRWKPKQPLHLLVLRGHRFLEPVDIPWRDEYRGCTSWGDLVGLPPDPTALASEAVLSDQEFEARYDAVREQLPIESLPT